MFLSNQLSNIFKMKHYKWKQRLKFKRKKNKKKEKKKKEEYNKRSSKNNNWLLMILVYNYQIKKTLFCNQKSQ